MNVEITENTYNRLGSHSIGFEKPESVIVRLLDFYENRKTNSKPKIVFLPDEGAFKEQLISQKTAWKLFEFSDGSIELEKWSASKLNENSNLRANLWSGALRDWQAKGVKKLTLSIEKPKKIQKEYSVNGTVEIQIGKFIKNHLDSIIEYCKNNSSHINELMNVGWSQQHFDLSSFPFMCLSSEISTVDSVRYWKPEYSIGSKKYRFCSQFGGKAMVGTKTKSEYQGQKFIQYLKSKGLLLPEYKDVEIRFVVKS